MNQQQVFETNSCSSGYQEVEIEDLTVIRGEFPVVSSSGTFVIGGDEGRIYYSNTHNQWISSGSDPSETSIFLDCNELIFGSNEFYSSCFRSILKSMDGKTWNSFPYSLASNNDIQLNFLTWGEDKLWAIGGSKRIYESKSGEYWSLKANIEVQNDDEMDLNSLFYFPDDMLISLGQDVFDGKVTPVVVYSENNGEKWYVMASSALLYSITYSESEEKWIGAGQGGLYYSSDFSTWHPIEPVNGECWHIISSPDTQYMIAQCTNRPNSDAIAYDDIIMTSDNGGQDWSIWYSPCFKSHHDTQQKEVCNPAVYIKEWKSFVLTSSAHTGGIHATMLDYFATSWHRAYFPYAVSFSDMDQGNGRIVSLAHDLIFSGPLSVLLSTAINDAIPYNQTRTGGSLPIYPVRGIITTIPDDSNSSNGDSSNLDGGAIAGAVIGSIVGAFLLVVLCLIIALLAFIVYNRTPKTSAESAAILNDEGL